MNGLPCPNATIFIHDCVGIATITFDVPKNICDALRSCFVEQLVSKQIVNVVQQGTLLRNATILIYITTFAAFNHYPFIDPAANKGSFLALILISQCV